MLDKLLERLGGISRNKPFFCQEADFWMKRHWRTLASLLQALLFLCTRSKDPNLEDTLIKILESPQASHAKVTNHMLNALYSMLSNMLLIDHKTPDDMDFVDNTVVQVLKADIMARLIDHLSRASPNELNYHRYFVVCLCNCYQIPKGRIEISKNSLASALSATALRTTEMAAVSLLQTLTIYALQDSVRFSAANGGTLPEELRRLSHSSIVTVLYPPHLFLNACCRELNIIPPLDSFLPFTKVMGYYGATDDKVKEYVYRRIFQHENPFLVCTRIVERPILDARVYTSASYKFFPKLSQSTSPTADDTLSSILHFDTVAAVPLSYKFLSRLRRTLERLKQVLWMYNIELVGHDPYIRKFYAHSAVASCLQKVDALCSEFLRSAQLDAAMAGRYDVDSVYTIDWAGLQGFPRRFSPLLFDCDSDFVHERFKQPRGHRTIISLFNYIVDDTALPNIAVGLFTDNTLTANPYKLDDMYIGDHCECVGISLQQFILRALKYLCPAHDLCVFGFPVAVPSTKAYDSSLLPHFVTSLEHAINTARDGTILLPLEVSLVFGPSPPSDSFTVFKNNLKDAGTIIGAADPPSLRDSLQLNVEQLRGSVYTTCVEFCSIGGLFNNKLLITAAPPSDSPACEASDAARRSACSAKRTAALLELLSTEAYFAGNIIIPSGVVLPLLRLVLYYSFEDIFMQGFYESTGSAPAFLIFARPELFITLVNNSFARHYNARESAAGEEKLFRSEELRMPACRLRLTEERFKQFLGPILADGPGPSLHFGPLFKVGERRVSLAECVVCFVRIISQCFTMGYTLDEFQTRLLSTGDICELLLLDQRMFGDDYALLRKVHSLDRNKGQRRRIYAAKGYSERRSPAAKTVTDQEIVTLSGKVNVRSKESLKYFEMPVRVVGCQREECFDLYEYLRGIDYDAVCSGAVNLPVCPLCGVYHSRWHTGSSNELSSNPSSRNLHKYASACTIVFDVFTHYLVCLFLASGITDTRVSINIDATFGSPELSDKDASLLRSTLRVADYCTIDDVRRALLTSDKTGCDSPNSPQGILWLTANRAQFPCEVYDTRIENTLLLNIPFFFALAKAREPSLVPRSSVDASELRQMIGATYQNRLSIFTLDATFSAHSGEAQATKTSEDDLQVPKSLAINHPAGTSNGLVRSGAPSANNPAELIIDLASSDEESIPHLTSPSAVTLHSSRASNTILPKNAESTLSDSDWSLEPSASDEDERIAVSPVCAHTRKMLQKPKYKIVSHITQKASSQVALSDMHDMRSFFTALDASFDRSYIPRYASFVKANCETDCSRFYALNPNYVEEDSTSELLTEVYVPYHDCVQMHIFDRFLTPSMVPYAQSPNVTKHEYNGHFYLRSSAYFNGRDNLLIAYAKRYLRHEQFESYLIRLSNMLLNFQQFQRTRRYALPLSVFYDPYSYLPLAAPPESRRVLYDKTYKRPYVSADGPLRTYASKDEFRSLSTILAATRYTRSTKTAGLYLEQYGRISRFSNKGYYRCVTPICATGEICTFPGTLFAPPAFEMDPVMQRCAHVHWSYHDPETEVICPEASFIDTSCLSRRNAGRLAEDHVVSRPARRYGSGSDRSPGDLSMIDSLFREMFSSNNPTWRAFQREFADPSSNYSSDDGSDSNLSSSSGEHAIVPPLRVQPRFIVIGPRTAPGARSRTPARGNRLPTPSADDICDISSD